MQEQNIILYWTMYISTIIFNTILFIFGSYVLIKVCKTNRLIFPIAIVVSLLVFSVASVVALIAFDFLKRLYQGDTVTCHDGIGTAACKGKILAYVQTYIVGEIVKSAAENTSLWVFCYKYFESSVIFPFIVKREAAPKWLMVLLKVTFWVILVINIYFTTVMQVNVYKLVLDIWFPNKNVN